MPPSATTDAWNVPWRAYNAGPERVDEWKKGSYRDMPEFVESTPFTETREYVQAIVRNVSLYQRLYQSP